MAVYSVSQVNTYLGDLLAQDVLLQDLWVRGEVANLARPGSGHTYFTLRDPAATLRCAMFRGASGPELLSNGGSVVTHGRVAVYAVRGDLQLIVDMVQPEGVGELQMKLEQLRLKLEAQGLFEESRKRPIPELPRKVGVVTSPTGAVWHDIRTVIRRRFPLVELLLAPTTVQGEGAVPGIVEALGALNEIPDLDVVIVARGGGSLEDLWPFNEEAVARAIFGSRVPVISAIGHETDITIADMVADVRAPTPSAAAELAVPDMMEIAAGLAASRQTLGASVAGRLQAKLSALRQLEPRVRHGQPLLDSLRLRVDDQLRSAAAHLRRDLALKSERAAGLAMRLESLSPQDTLRRGYAIVQADVDKALVGDSSQVGVGDAVKVTLHRGAFGAEVTSVQADRGGWEPQ